MNRVDIDVEELRWPKMKEKLDSWVLAGKGSTQVVPPAENIRSPSFSGEQTSSEGVPAATFAAGGGAGYREGRNIKRLNLHLS